MIKSKAVKGFEFDSSSPMRKYLIDVVAGTSLADRATKWPNVVAAMALLKIAIDEQGRSLMNHSMQATFSRVK